ncbi:hypothetical protein KIPB_014547, partial [Kipferlia bialata]|eukprot:g14547.t1
MRGIVAALSMGGQNPENVQGIESLAEGFSSNIPPELVAMLSSLP